jgi:hypothetical protein
MCDNVCARGAGVNLTIQLKVSKALQAKLKKLENPQRAIDRGLRDYMADIEPEVVKYAPSSAANRSPGINGYSWYERRLGTRTITGKLYKTSQDMRNRWTFKTKSNARGIRATIVNNTSYARYVVGLKQAGFHARRGWKKTHDIVERTIGDATDRIDEQIEKELAR